MKIKDKQIPFPESKKVIIMLLDKVVGCSNNFKGSRQFYTATKINNKRWAKILKGELSITIDELKNVCKYLNVSFSAETFTRQLKLFTDDKKLSDNKKLSDKKK
jgi:hypothetical protein